MQIRHLENWFGHKRYTQAQLAELGNIPQTYLLQIENNQKAPTIQTIKSIVENLAIPLPVVLFMAVENEDIQENKCEIYSMISPSFKSLLDVFFSDDK